MERVDQRKMSLADFCVAQKHSRNTKLDDINSIINWQPFERLLRKNLPRKPDAVGNLPYPSLLMFKCLLLQRLYNLSDAETEASLADRISFLRFVGLGMEDDIPDASTICRFRNSLLEKKLAKKLFDEFTGQLLKKGLKMTKGIAVDASVVRSSRHSRTVVENMPADRNEPDLQEGPGDCLESRVVISHSDDTEAAWVKKAGRSYYGYKVHMASDCRTGLILGGHITPANRSDMNELKAVLDEVPLQPGTRCLADKGYASAANRDAVTKLGLKEGIMRKAVRGRPLSKWEQRRNKCISTVRSGIERIFGNLKRNFHFDRSRYVGQKKVEQEFFLVALGANLVRSLSLIAK